MAPTCLLSPFPLAGPLVVVGKTALDHIAAPLIARHDEGSETAAAEAKRAEQRPQSSSASRFTAGAASRLPRSVVASAAAIVERGAVPIRIRLRVVVWKGAHSVRRIEARSQQI